MGSRRGCLLHNNEGRITRQWARTPWITSLLQFMARHRTTLLPGKHTRLFFLFEATALAAGHRPCATCRRSADDPLKAS
jgi:hypothetical protein